MTRIRLALLLAPFALAACQQPVGSAVSPRVASDTAASGGVSSSNAATLPHTTAPQSTGNTSTGLVTRPGVAGRPPTAAGSGSAATGMR